MSMSVDLDSNLSPLGIPFENELGTGNRLADSTASNSVDESLDANQALEEERARKYRENYRAQRDASSLATLNSQALTSQTANAKLEEITTIDPPSILPIPKPPSMATTVSEILDPERDLSHQKKANLAYLVLKLGMKELDSMDDKLRDALSEVKKEEERVRLVLQLKKELNKHQENSKKFELSPQSLELIAALEKLGSPILDTSKDPALTPGQFQQLKAQIDSIMSLARSKQQTIFTTEFQVTKTEQTLLRDLISKLIKSDEELKKRIAEQSKV